MVDVDDKPIGCYCVVIQKQLVTSNCPLPTGTCVWKDRLSGQCRYVNQDLKVNELARRVHSKTLNLNEAQALKSTLLHEIKTALK